jgi:hypothetical protein
MFCEIRGKLAFPVEEKYIEKAEGEFGAKFPDSFPRKRTCHSIVQEKQIARSLPIA